MAYNNEFDPLVPTDLDPAHEGDDRIREIKAALIERLETVFEDIDEDPLVPRIERFGFPFRAEYDADESTGNRISDFGLAEKILAFTAKGNTNADGELDVFFGAFSGETDVTFNLSNCIALFATPRAPDIAAVTPNQAILRIDASNMITLRVQNETVHFVRWSVLAVFKV